MKKALYSRVQGEKESVRDFTRAIMDLVNKLPHETDVTRNRLLNEVICDNLRSQAIRDECARLVDKNIDVAFTDVRHVAMRMGDKDDSRSGTAINVNLVHARSDSDYDVECCARQGDKSDSLHKLSSVVEKMLEGQQQLIALIQQQSHLHLHLQGFGHKGS